VLSDALPGKLTFVPKYERVPLTRTV